MPKPGTPRSILVLEDEIIYLELAVMQLEKIGFEVLSARSVDEALSLMTELKTVDLEPKTIDAIWLDHFLPEKNGNVFLQEILKHPEWSKIPVFLVTNAVEPEITNWYLRAGVQQYYPKMTNPPEKIVTSIDLYLQQHHRDDDMPATIHQTRA